MATESGKNVPDVERTYIVTRPIYRKPIQIKPWLVLNVNTYIWKTFWRMAVG